MSRNIVPGLVGLSDPGTPNPATAVIDSRSSQGTVVVDLAPTTFVSPSEVVGAQPLTKGTS